MNIQLTARQLKALFVIFDFEGMSEMSSNLLQPEKRGLLSEEIQGPEVDVFHSIESSHAMFNIFQHSSILPCKGLFRFYLSDNI